MLKAGLTTIIGALVFQTAAMAQIYVKNPGNVGIGVANPDFKLQVNGFTEIGDQNAHDPSKYGVLQLIRPANQGDDKYHLSFIKAGNSVSGFGYIPNTNSFALWACTNANTSTPTMAFPPNGNVGIGIAQPTAKLTIPNAGSSSLRVGVNSNMANTHTQLLNSMAVLGVDQNDVSSSGAVASDFFNNGNNPTWAGTLLFHYGIGLNGDIYPNIPVNKKNLGVLHFQNQSNGLIVGSSNIYIAPSYGLSTTFSGNGNVGIGTTNPGHKLHVMGNVRANSFIADGNTWADYVFDSAYHLPSLQEVKAYISKNHHLPEVPSTEDVKKDGLNLSDNHVILLKKIEELTLYAIDQNEKLQLLEQKLNALMENDKKQKEEIENLKKKKVRQ